MITSDKIAPKLITSDKLAPDIVERFEKLEEELEQAKELNRRLLEQYYKMEAYLRGVESLVQGETP